MCFFFVFKHKTALEVRISDWSSDVCSSDLIHFGEGNVIEYPGRTDWNAVLQVQKKAFERERLADAHAMLFIPEVNHENATGLVQQLIQGSCPGIGQLARIQLRDGYRRLTSFGFQMAGGNYYTIKCVCRLCQNVHALANRSEEHTSELQSLMRTSNSIF